VEAGDTRTDTGHLVAPTHQNQRHEVAEHPNEAHSTQPRKIEVSAALARARLPLRGVPLPVTGDE